MKVTADNGTRLLCVIGSPVMHSMSPTIQNFMVNELGINYIYLPFEVRPEGLSEFINSVKTLNIAGFNATMPHKEILLPFLDTISDDAKALGAVNTVTWKNGCLNGYNTDGEGFLRSLFSEGIEVSNKNILILGAGGAAKAVVMKLHRAKAAKITVLNRDKNKAEKLAYGRENRVFSDFFSYNNIISAIKDCDLLVNCTPLGMHGVAEDFNDMTFFDAAPDNMAVCDLIYKPPRTKFLEYAERRGLKCINGAGMLIHQAILALEIFADVEIDAYKMAPKIRKLFS